MRGIVAWHDYICEILRDSLTRAQPTGSTIEPKGIVSFSQELIEEMLAQSPFHAPDPK